MTLVWSANELLTGKKYQDKGPTIAFKNGRQAFSSTIDLQSDADLKLTLPQTSATYLVEVNYGVTGTSVTQIKLAWDVTGDATVVRTMQAMEGGGTNSNNALLISRELSTAGWLAGAALAQAPCAVREKWTVTTGTEPATLTLKWCQNVSDTTATSVHDYGWAIARRLI